MEVHKFSDDEYREHLRGILSAEDLQRWDAAKALVANKTVRVTKIPGIAEMNDELRLLLKTQKEMRMRKKKLKKYSDEWKRANEELSVLIAWQTALRLSKLQKKKEYLGNGKN